MAAGGEKSIAGGSSSKDLKRKGAKKVGNSQADHRDKMQVTNHENKHQIFLAQGPRQVQARK